MGRVTHAWRVLCVVLVIVLSGCASSATRTEIGQLADAGRASGAAMTELTAAARPAVAAASAERLLLVRDAPTEVRKELIDTEQEDITRLRDIYRKINVSGATVSRYYATVADLANSNASAEIKEQTQLLADQITELNSTLGITSPEALTVLPGIAGFAVNQQIEAALREELRQRGPNLVEIHRAQSMLLGELETQLTTDLEVARNDQARREVFRPYEEGLLTTRQEIDRWKTDYMRFYTEPALLAAVEQAKAASMDLAGALEATLSGEVTADRLRSAIAQFSQTFALLAELRRTT